MNNIQVHKQGRERVDAELLRRGASSVKSSPTRGFHLEVKNSDESRTIEIKVKTRRKGNWHTRTIEGKPTDTPLRDNGQFWIFVDLGGEPRFWIVYDAWIRDNIYRTHEKYLNDHRGHRPKNDASDHHSINETRLETWQDRWDILGI